MKTSRYIILSFAAVAIAASCKEELNPDKPINANPGDEVVFGAALPGKTKTVYGVENSDGFPIYWVNGDKVRVASPQCMSGRNSAEYAVAVQSATQNYATSLTKTGEYGVQWGDAETANFYSIYPSSASTALEVSGEGVTTTLHVDATQFASTTDNGTSYYAQPAEMGNVVMYAKATASKTDPAVELHYTPFSTVLEFTLIAQSKGGTEEPLIIQSITLTAPTGTTIAGDFAFNFPSGEGSTPSIEAMTGGSNAITMHFLKDNQYNISLTPTKNTMKAKMCLMPISSVSSLAGWKVEVNTSAGTFIKTLDADDLTGKNTALAPGKVHKITLPKLGFVSDEWVYDPSEWIPSLPDYENIYLSELSLPGAWYTGSTETYQTNSDVPTLWNAGVRAFAVECRSYSTGRYAAPSRICISGSGGSAGDAYSDYEGIFGFGSHDAIYISTVIKDICDKLASQTDVSKQEYAVLVLSYADGGDGGHRDVDHDYFLNGIDNEITRSGVDRKYIFGNNGETLSRNTTVDDVKGKLIIKVNMDYDTYGTRSGRYQSGVARYTDYSYTYGNNLNSAISYTPFLKTIGSNNYAHPCYSNLYWKEWSDENKQFGLISELNGSQNGDGFIWVFSSANRTHADVSGGSTYDIPTYADRKSALGAMMTYSKQIYDASTHNVWFYFNCGGTQATSSTSKNPSPTDFAKEMNAWLLSTINAKTDPSPLGIVMFNQCTGANATYHGEDIIKAIIEMNSKFYLKHAGTSGGSTGGSTSGNEAPNDATFANGSNAI